MNSLTKPDAVLHCAGQSLDLRTPKVMGILNITPDSFSDGGRWLQKRGRTDLNKKVGSTPLIKGGEKKGQTDFLGKSGSTPFFEADVSAICAEAERMVANGAAVLDVGGESTRPGAAVVSEQEELDRVIPVVEALRQSVGAIISVDSSTPAVMREAAAAGAGMLNDVRALRRQGAMETAAATGLPVCLMHMQGEPGSMQDEPRYDAVVADVASYLQERIEACRSAGIDADRILLDPGFGFGKTVKHNLALLNGLPKLRELGFPLLVGLSRKSLIGKLTGRNVDERLAGSISLALLAAERGAALVRVHDVAETTDALRIFEAVREAEEAAG